ncbi:hypothetical protein C8Q74DRAFT_1279705 [Fomes fomentarius]|nr:hypothetical protein C8Q74DRAFT_1279705 [Fomes fomentarius]
MSRPDLYRSGNAASPRFDNVRVGKDIQVDSAGNVHPNTGGISTFATKDSTWADNKTWVLRRTTQLVSGLQARNDTRNHWSIEPSSVMKVETYTSHLTQLNSAAVRYDRLPKSAEAQAEAAPEPRVLKTQSAHVDRAARFVYDALVSVVHSRVHVEGWDENDYAYVAELAHALEAGVLPLSALVWDEEGEWSKERVFAADAVSAYIGRETVRVKESGSEDEQADADNDHAYLRAVLKFDDRKNPFVA